MMQAVRREEIRYMVDISKSDSEMIQSGKIRDGRSSSEERSRSNIFQATPQGIEDVDLKKKFPCSPRKPFRLSFRQFVSFLLVGLVSILADHYFVSGLEADTVRNTIQSAMLAFIFLGALNWLFAYWLVKLRGNALKYFIRDGSVVITKGLFLKKSGCFHLSHITDVYLVQEQLDWLFNTCTLCVSTANQSSGQFAFIEGFDEETAHRFQEYLLKQSEASSSLIHSTFQDYSRSGQYVA